MIKTICLYGFPPHIRSDINYSFVKRGDNRNLSSASKQKWQNGLHRIPLKR